MTHKMIFDDLPDTIYSTLEMKPDSRYKNWTKIVDKIDPAGTNGFAFDGPYINGGTCEVALPRPRLILAAALNGSRRDIVTAYGFAILNTDGTLEAAPIPQTTDETKGWALRLRDPAIALLSTLKAQRVVETPVVPPPTVVETPSLTLGEEVESVLSELRPLMGDQPDDSILLFALTRLLYQIRPTGGE